jgi:protease PrsW
VVLTYLFVSLLHGLWDGLPRVLYVVVPPGIPISVVTLTLSAIGIIVLVALYRQAERRQMPPAASLEP